MDRITPVKVVRRAEQDLDQPDPTQHVLGRFESVRFECWVSQLGYFWVRLVVTCVLLIKFDHLGKKSNFYFNSYCSKKKFFSFLFFFPLLFFEFKGRLISYKLQNHHSKIANSVQTYKNNIIHLSLAGNTTI